MKILLINNSYRVDGGGAETVLLRTRHLLQQAGHQVVVFSLQEPETIVHPWRDFSPDASRLAREQFRRRDSLATVYSLKIRRLLGRLLVAYRPDVAHLHNVYESSPCRSWMLSTTPESRRS